MPQNKKRQSKLSIMGDLAKLMKVSVGIFSETNERMRRFQKAGVEIENIQVALWRKKLELKFGVSIELDKSADATSLEDLANDELFGYPAYSSDLKEIFRDNGNSSISASLSRSGTHQDT